MFVSFRDLKLITKQSTVNSSIFIYKIYKEKVIKRKIVNLQMRKNE